MPKPATEGVGEKVSCPPQGDGIPVSGLARTWRGCAYVKEQYNCEAAGCGLPAATTASTSPPDDQSFGRAPLRNTWSPLQETKKRSAKRREVRRWRLQANSTSFRPRLRPSTTFPFLPSSQNCKNQRSANRSGCVADCFFKAPLIARYTSFVHLSSAWRHSDGVCWCPADLWPLTFGVRSRELLLIRVSGNSKWEHIVVGVCLNSLQFFLIKTVVVSCPERSCFQTAYFFRGHEFLLVSSFWTLWNVLWHLA